MERKTFTHIAQSGSKNLVKSYTYPLLYCIYLYEHEIYLIQMHKSHIEYTISYFIYNEYLRKITTLMFEYEMQ